MKNRGGGGRRPGNEASKSTVTAWILHDVTSDSIATVQEYSDLQQPKGTSLS